MITMPANRYVRAEETFEQHCDPRMGMPLLVTRNIILDSRPAQRGAAHSGTGARHFFVLGAWPRGGVR